MAAGYTISNTGNVTTITLSNDTTEVTMWGITGQVQLRATSFTNSNAEYRVSQAGVQDIVIPYDEIVSFSGPTIPSGDPVTDFSLFVDSFPNFAAAV